MLAVLFILISCSTDNNSKYLTFLEVAKSGLKLAGGKGDKSFLQNFAEAFEDLPTFLQKIAITENQQDKALKMQALNLVLEEEKRAQLAPLERFKALPEKVRTALSKLYLLLIILYTNSRT